MESLIQIEYADKIGNISSVNGKTASVKKGGLSCRQTDSGAILIFTFPKEGFVIPVEFTLTDDALSASILVREIQETNDAYRLTTLSLLPYFGAAGRRGRRVSVCPGRQRRPHRLETDKRFTGRLPPVRLRPGTRHLQNAD